MNKKRFYIANWKMNLTYEETITFATHSYDALISLANPTTTIVLCPSYPALYPLAQIFKATGIYLGAQGCSNHQDGAFTGQVSAADLSSVGCTYCIIGHSEQRQFLGETHQTVAQKTILLLDAGISPIICIGETAEQNQQGQTIVTLEHQLTPLMQRIHERETLAHTLPLLVAYEPVWAIGSGSLPTVKHLQTVYAWLKQFLTLHTPSLPWHMLYGGSISSATAQEFASITELDGFLIGGASLDFQEFEKIVKYGK
jgi:triosephosphate isomerase